jgi:hypothetical protein
MLKHDLSHYRRRKENGIGVSIVNNAFDRGDLLIWDHNTDTIDSMDNKIWEQWCEMNSISCFKKHAELKLLDQASKLTTLAFLAQFSSNTR